MKASLRSRRVLLVLDDVWEPEHAKPFAVGGPGRLSTKEHSGPLSHTNRPPLWCGLESTRGLRPFFSPLYPAA